MEELETEAAATSPAAGQGGGEGSELRAGVLLAGEALGWFLEAVVEDGPLEGDAGHDSTPGVQGVFARDLREQVLRNVEKVCEGPVLAVAVVLRVRLDEQEDVGADEVRGTLQHAGGGAVLYMAGRHVSARAGACWRRLVQHFLLSNKTLSYINAARAAGMADKTFEQLHTKSVQSKMNRHEKMRAGLQAAQTALEGGGTLEELDNVVRMLVKMGAEDLKLQAIEARQRAIALRPTGDSVQWAYAPECQYFLALMDDKLYAMRAETAESLSTSLEGARSEVPSDRREQVYNFATALKKVAGRVWNGLEFAGVNVLPYVPQQQARTAAPDQTLDPRAHMQALCLRVRNL